MSELELDFEMAEVPSPEVIQISQTMSGEEDDEVTILETNFITNCKENNVDFVNNAYGKSGLSSPEVIEVSDSLGSEEGENKKLDAGEAKDTNETNSDLEEGEIKEPDDCIECIDITPVVCRYFQTGTCFLGKSCRFLHVGVSSYKMFDSTLRYSQPSIVEPMPVYHPITSNQPVDEFPDSWDKGLREAKKLLLNAKLKKETDLDFEEKQLYQGLDDDGVITNIKKRRKLGLAEKPRKRDERPKDSSRLKHSELGRKALKTFHKGLPCSRNPTKVKVRTRNRSNSWSPIPSRHRRSQSPNSPSSSSCSECKTSWYGSEKNFRKTKSKLERVFSRTFDAPETSRSRRLATPSRSFSPYRRSRSLSRRSFIKRFIYRSYSKTPPRNKYSKKRPEKDVAHKPHRKQPTSPPPETQKKHASVCSEKEHIVSPFSKLLSRNCTRELRSISSDMTVSSIKCTSLSASRLSSEENKSTKHSKSPKIFSGRMSNDMGNSVQSKSEHENSSTHDSNKWQDTVPKSTKESECRSEISKKIADKKKEMSSKPIEKSEAPVKRYRKPTSCSNTTDEELSADELELLRYIPNRNCGKLKQVAKKANNNVQLIRPSVKPLPPRNDHRTFRENPSTKATVEHLPPKIVYDYGCDTECLSTKIVPSEESPTSKAPHDHGTCSENHFPRKIVSNKISAILETPHDNEKGSENHFPKEFNNTEQSNPFTNKSNEAAQEKCPSTKILNGQEKTIPDQFVKNKMEQNKGSLRSNDFKKRRWSESSVERERPLSAGELELLKYAAIGNPAMSEEIRKKTRKNPPLLAAKKAKQKTESQSESKYSSPKSLEQKKVRTTEMSRREQLMQQLEAVELAIAKKKRLAKLEYAKLRKKQKSYN